MGLKDAFRSILASRDATSLASLEAHPVEGFPQSMVGESRYLDEFVSIFGRRTEDGVDREVWASLEHENSNPYDPMAIAVTINGRTIGHLSRLDARLFRAGIAKCGYAGRSIRCRAHVRGGWDRGCGDDGDFGVTLAIDISSPV